MSGRASRSSAEPGRRLTPPWRNLMRTGSDPDGDPPTAARQAGRAVSSLFADTRLTGWHGDLAGRIDQLGWLRTLSDRLTGVLGPLRERHQDNLLLELLHG